MTHLLNFRDQSVPYTGYPPIGPPRIKTTAYPYPWQTARTACRTGKRALLWMRIVKAGRMYRGQPDDYR